MKFAELIKWPYKTTFLKKQMKREHTNEEELQQKYRFRNSKLI